jgi:glutamate/tyrosine decarboxylase-like PLP-dependent enzyme
MDNNKKTKVGRKNNDLEVAERFQRGFEYILYKRPSYNEFRETFSQQESISIRQAELIYQKVKETIKQRFEDEKGELIQAQIERYMDLLERSRESGNRRIEREVLNDLNKLWGLEQATKVDVTSGGETIQLNIVLNK